MLKPDFEWNKIAIGFDGQSALEWDLIAIHGYAEQLEEKANKLLGLSETSAEYFILEAEISAIKSVLLKRTFAYENGGGDMFLAAFREEKNKELSAKAFESAQLLNHNLLSETLAEKKPWYKRLFKV